MKMGAREFLFLWGMALDRKYRWPHMLTTTSYNSSTDSLVGSAWCSYNDRQVWFEVKVMREGSESCDILKKHGLTQDAIDAAVKKYLEETYG